MSDADTEPLASVTSRSFLGPMTAEVGVTKIDTTTVIMKRSPPKVPESLNSIAADVTGARRAGTSQRSDSLDSEPLRNVEYEVTSHDVADQSDNEDDSFKLALDDEPEKVVVDDDDVMYTTPPAEHTTVAIEHKTITESVETSQTLKKPDGDMHLKRSPIRDVNVAPASIQTVNKSDSLTLTVVSQMSQSGGSKTDRSLVVSKSQSQSRIDSRSSVDSPRESTARLSSTHTSTEEVHVRVECTKEAADSSDGAGQAEGDVAVPQTPPRHSEPPSTAAVKTPTRTPTRKSRVVSARSRQQTFWHFKSCTLYMLYVYYSRRADVFLLLRHTCS